MCKAKKLYALLGVLLVICAAAFIAARYQEKKENIKNSGEVFLTISADDVTALSWTNESGTFSFSKGDSWTYDDDAAFPVSEDKIADLISTFESFAAAFVIEEVEDYSQYGLDDPVCTISITADETSYTIKLGDFSKMDEQRYISVGDGNVYLATHDPLDEFGAVLRDMIKDDTIPEFDTVERIEFSSSENYTVIRDEDGESICESDVFFTDGEPLDTDSVNSLLNSIQSITLTNYVSYNASDEELAAFGLNDPDLTIRLEYSTDDDDGNTVDSGSLLLQLSRNQEEAAAYEDAVEAGEDDLPDVTCYIRLGQSQIVYEITQSTYKKLTAVSYDTLRHQELFTADFDTVTVIEAALEGESYTFTYTQQEDKDNGDDEGIWTYNDDEFDVFSLKSALCAISASEFAAETPAGQEEITLTLHLQNEKFQTFTLTLYRYDGTNCIAAVDGKPIALVSRSQTVNLIEAVNEVILGS